MGKLLKIFLSPKTAQAAMELAIFGAILTFVLGLIVRQAYNTNYVQNHSLRAMRVALSESAKTSHGFGNIVLPGPPGSIPSTARSSASVLYIEDRLTPDAGKYGAMTRTPFVSSGSGTFSQNLFLPVEYSSQIAAEDYNLPRFDLFVNDQHFTFTMAGFGRLTGLDQFGTLPFGYGNDWLPVCATRNIWVANAWVPENRGCLAFYAQIVNNINFGVGKNDYCWERWGTGTCQVTTPDPPCCDERINLGADARFDLDRNPLTTGFRENLPGQDDGGPCAPGYTVGLKTCRQEFAWQWFLVKAFMPERSNEWGPAPFNGMVVQRVIPFLNSINAGAPEPYGETILINGPKRENIIVDVDRDLREETILEADVAPSGVIRTVYYLDDQAGDVDFARDDSSLGPDPGLQDRVVMYTRTNEGTYYVVDQGQLLTPGDGRIVRSITKHDRIDLIERVFQLSNDTGHICGNGTKANPAGPDCTIGNPSNCAYWDTPSGTPNYKQNPDVKWCSSGTGPHCFHPTRINETCFDEGGATLYIRSHLRDLSGRKWITRISN